MLINSLRIQNFRSFVDTGYVPLANINVFTGANNSGKSSVLLAIYQFQSGYGPRPKDVRVSCGTSSVSLSFPDIQAIDALKPTGFTGAGVLTQSYSTADRRNGAFQIEITSSVNGNRPINIFSDQEPGHFLIPHLSKRKASGYTEDVRLQHVLTVSSNLSFLPAKLSRICSPGFPGHDTYKEKCIEILGFFVTNLPSESGQTIGVYLPDGQQLSIDSMGEGVPNIVSLLADLVTAKGKVFLIEEPENDLHPQALKALLDLIVESSKYNQFFISTHSNIVVRNLASSDNSRLFSVTSEFGVLPPVAMINEIEPTVEARLAVLHDLGYSFSDFELWDGWLVLEESSAERIIRDYLIPWFAPKLSRIRTLSACGVDKVEPVFEDYNRLVRFTHLESAYKNSAWVLVDGDDKGRLVVEKLRSNYSSWDADRFQCLSNAQFEHYYPAQFASEIAESLSKPDKQERRKAKAELLHSVLGWLEEDEARGKDALSNSAAEVIELLRGMERTLLKR